MFIIDLPHDEASPSKDVAILYENRKCFSNKQLCGLPYAWNLSLSATNTGKT